MEWRTELAKVGSIRTLMLLTAAVGLFFVYLFQDVFSPSFWGGQVHPNMDFCIRKVVRVSLNDALMVVLVGAWFNDKQINSIAYKIVLLDLLILVPLYLSAKLYFEGPGEISSPLLSHLHRIIVNPIILALLIPAVYLQRIGK